jgi:hypothetical protein
MQTLSFEDVVRFNIHTISKEINKTKHGTIAEQGLINPSWDSWDSYAGMKREASIWLTARKIVRIYRENADHIRTFEQLDLRSYTDDLYDHVPGVVRDDDGQYLSFAGNEKRVERFARLARGRLIRIRRLLEDRALGKSTKSWAAVEEFASVDRRDQKVRAELDRKEEQHA